MPETVADLFLAFSQQRLALASSRIQDCLSQLSEEQVWARGGDNENSVANLVLHLCGNVRQWILSGVGGDIDLRDRDAEFTTAGGVSVADLRAKLQSTVEQALTVIRAVPAGRLTEHVTAQGREPAVLEAIYTVVEHFAQHTGQIIFATKMLTGKDLGYTKHLGTHRPAR